MNEEKNDLVLETEINYPDNFIRWEDILIQKNNMYFVYVFSYDCYFCKQTKTKVINFYNNGELDVFFVEYTKQIPINNDTSKTIGVSSIKNIFIRGTPSLILINNGNVAINVGGKSEVEEIIDLYLKI